MGAVAVTIVHHSAPLLGYPTLRYTSRVDLAGSCAAFCGGGQSVFNAIDFLGLLPMLAIYLLAVPLGAIVTVVLGPLLLVPPCRALLLQLVTKYLNYPGDPHSRTHVRTRGVGASGDVVHAVVSLPGDPGIYCTALCMAETALAMLDTAQGSTTPPTPGSSGDEGAGAQGLPAGFTTPLHACGEALVARLGRAKGATVQCGP